MIGRILGRFFAKKPPKSLNELFLFNVAEIEIYLRSFLKRTAEIHPSHFKKEEITNYALTIATLGWQKANLNLANSELEDLQTIALRRASKGKSNEEDLVFLRPLFSKRLDEYSDMHLRVLGLHKDGPQGFSNEAGTALAVHFVGCATGLQLSPHLLFSCNLEFLRTVDYVDMCSRQFIEANPS